MSGSAYQLHGILAFHLAPDSAPLPRTLERRLAVYRIPEPAPGSIALHLGSIPKAGTGHRQSGRYKQIPWQSLVVTDGAGELREVWFHAPWFRNFLLFRLFFLPALWRAAVRHGGFYLLGTAYRNAGVTHLLFAPPGAGKTRNLLRQLTENPAMELIGDGSLLFLPGRGIIPVLPEIELRYLTVRHTAFWKQLRPQARRRLQWCRLISALTRRKISFNITVVPEEFGCRTGLDHPDEPHVFEKVEHGRTTLPPPACAEREILDYLQGYVANYPYIFPEPPPLSPTATNFVNFRRQFFPEG